MRLQTDRRTDRRTGWFQYTPPPNFVAGGITRYDRPPMTGYRCWHDIDTISSTSRCWRCKRGMTRYRCWHDIDTISSTPRCRRYRKNIVNWTYLRTYAKSLSYTTYICMITYVSPQASSSMYLDGTWSDGNTDFAYCTAIILAWGCSCNDENTGTI